ncbi:hypothetical protein [Cohnella sp. WQ 127256]|uniref:hypothetical protein n=1 Tax=Cohnella sp. WQ 127256 TaxID=2938790 RepID=UPI0021173429|nr:hypothetical protein [Cohnella sp. WQ 127256]
MDALGKDEPVKIKVMFWDSNYFFSEYGNLFATQFSNVEIEVANMQSIYNDSTTTPDKAMAKFIEENKPDVLMLQGDQYEKYAQEGKLFALDSVIEQDEFNMDGIHPAIIKLLREQGNGKLYGLDLVQSSLALLSIITWIYSRRLV